MAFWNTVESELGRGELARSNGNEGQARVSARRAAGAVIREYFEQKGEPTMGLSSYDLIEIAHVSPSLPAEVIDLLSHFLMRVEQGGNFPGDIDLLAEVPVLAEKLGLYPDAPPSGK